jgi:hypothetical protein
MLRFLRLDLRIGGDNAPTKMISFIGPTAFLRVSVRAQIA